MFLQITTHYSLLVPVCRVSITPAKVACLLTPTPLTGYSGGIRSANTAHRIQWRHKKGIKFAWHQIHNFVQQKIMKNGQARAFLVIYKMNMLKFILFLFVLSTSLIAADAKLGLTLESVHVYGKHSVFFESITSVCEDDNNNLFVLDSRAHKIYKFSKNGKKTAVFGNKGLGPADMNRPHNIFFNSKRELVVNEVTGVVSYFDSNGTFLRKKRVARGLNTISLAEHIFYAWIWEKKSKNQVLLDENGKVLKSFFEISKDAFSINLPDETGRYVMFNSFSDSYTPFFVFHHYKDLSAIAVSNRYEIILINNDGSINKTIKRDIDPPVISSLERKYLETEIRNYKNFPPHVKKKFRSKIPKYKNFLNYILISGQYIWIFRPKKDLTNANELIPVDLYDLNGILMGSLTIKNLPYLIANKFMYFEETNSDEDLLLVKYKYRVGIAPK